MTDTTTRIIRVLLVDDRMDHLKHIGTLLLQTAKNRPDLMGGHQITLELCQNAYFAANQIQRASTKPRWDIVLSDVFMPLPLDDDNLTVPQDSAKSKKFKLGDDKWEVDAWLFNYINDGISHSHEHGGFHIAKTIRELRQSNSTRKLPRLALISSFLNIESSAQKLLREFLPAEAGWLYYFDKAAAMDEAGRNDAQADDWKERGFVLMLANCIASMDRDVWDQALFNQEESYGDFVADSPCMKKVMLKMSAVSREQIPRKGPPSVVVFNGEAGTGRRTAARAFRQMCGGSTNDLVWNTELNQDLDALIRMRSDLDSWGNQPCLIIEDFHLMKPAVQEFIVQITRSGSYRDARGSQKACPVARLVFARMNEEARSKVVEAVGKWVEITLPPLRERCDCFTGLVERIKRQIQRPNLHFDADLMKALRGQKWERNVAEFEGMIRSFISDQIVPLLTQEHFEAFLAKSAEHHSRNSSQIQLPEPVSQTVQQLSNENASSVKKKARRKNETSERVFILNPSIHSPLEASISEDDTVLIPITGTVAAVLRYALLSADDGLSRSPITCIEIANIIKLVQLVNEGISKAAAQCQLNAMNAQCVNQLVKRFIDDLGKKLNSKQLQTAWFLKKRHGKEEYIVGINLKLRESTSQIRSQFMNQIRGLLRT